MDDGCWGVTLLGRGAELQVGGLYQLVGIAGYFRIHSFV